MKFQHIIGADLSKKTIDLVHHQSKNHFQISNTKSGIKDFLKWLKMLKVDIASMMIVMEHTGLYSYCFENELHQRGLKFTKVNPVLIRQSVGLLRGKSDKIDAARIANYGYEKQGLLTADQPVAKAVQSLQRLRSARNLFVSQRAGLKCAVKEYRNINMQESDQVIQSILKMIKHFDLQIKKLEDEMQSVLNPDKGLKQNFDLLQSIKGVGKILAITTLIKTHNFTRFKDARKFACYCGTAPFEHTSGTSIMGKTRVSHLADKEMKTLLDMAAKAAIRTDKELKNYYQKRVEKGKSKMSSINVVRNKIIYRMFAVIKRQSPFIESYNLAA